MAKIKVKDPSALNFFTEEQIERSPTSDDIFLREGVGIPSTVNPALFETIQEAPVTPSPISTPSAPVQPTSITDTRANQLLNVFSDDQQQSIRESLRQKGISENEASLQDVEQAAIDLKFREPDTITQDGTDVSVTQQQLADLTRESDIELTSTLGQLDSLQRRLDATTNAVIDNIKKLYESRKVQQDQINKNALGAVTKAGIRAGRQQFAPEIQIGLLSEEESAGLSRLAALDAEEASLVLQAQQAKDEKDFELLNTRVNALERNRAEKRQAILDQHKLALDEEQRVLNRAKAAREELKFEVELQKFNQENEDRVAESVASGFVSLDSDFNVVGPTAQEINQAANELGISPNILLGQVNKQIEQLQKTARAERSARLDELKFEEQQKQNEIRNEFEQQRIGISAGQLALSRQKFGREIGIQISDDDKQRLISAGFNIPTLNNLQDRINAGETLDAILADSNITEDQEQTLRNTLAGITAAQEVAEDEFPAPTSAERRQAAQLQAEEEFEDRTFGFFDKIQEKKISKEEAIQKLVADNGISFSDAERIIEGIEKR